MGNAPKGSKYSVGSIYFIGGRNSRKFILYKDRSDAMYIGKCVGIESLKEHSIKDRKKSGAKSGISPEEYFKEIMDIKDGSAIREIMLERFKANLKKILIRDLPFGRMKNQKMSFINFLQKEIILNSEICISRSL